MRSRSPSARILEVACLSRAAWASSRLMPLPSSCTRTNERPPPSISTATPAAPASSAFSTSSLTTEAGRSTTSPAAILLTRSPGSRWTRIRGRGPRSDPLLPAEEPDEADADPDHEEKRPRVAVAPVQLGHELEVHAVDPGDDGERCQHGR